MLSNTMTVAAATPVGTALPGVRTPWAFLAAAGANHARTLIPGTAVASPCTRPLASRSGPAMAQQLAVLVADVPTTNEARKQNVHKTRIGAGYGAMGPYPEREPA